MKRKKKKTGLGKAVFLDRDGILNMLIFNPSTGEFESPHRPKDFRLVPGVEKQLARLRAQGYLLFLVSNQPSFAKGKTSMAALKAIHRKLESALSKAGVVFEEFNYCFHHPNSVVPELKGPCRCRKPSPYFLEEAIAGRALKRGNCWMIGDQDTDIQCGRAAGVKTILIETAESALKRGGSRPDFTVSDLAGAVDLVLESTGQKHINRSLKRGEHGL